MPFEHKWLIEDQVVYSRLWGDQTLKELEDSNTQILSFLEQSDRSVVHVIVNDKELKALPMSLIQTQKILTYTKHPKLGWAILVGDKEAGIKDSVKDFMITMVAKISRARYLRVKTFDEAVAHLNAVDTTINWDQVKSISSESD